MAGICASVRASANERRGLTPPEEKVTIHGEDFVQARSHANMHAHSRKCARAQA